ncbi:hypothetical protein PTTG_01750, partial [Puccinia triticina 1-1 BBBD Race 1]
MAAPCPSSSWASAGSGKRTTSSVQTIALSLGLKAAAPQALEAALSNLVLKSLYASDLHIDLRDYSYRFLLVLPCPKDLAAGAASTPCATSSPQPTIRTQANY